VARQSLAPGETPLFDHLLGLCAAAADPTSGGGHKVFGSKRLWVPPQTSTIASHLPKAVGAALAIERANRLGLAAAAPADAIVLCSFGDASTNHAAALSGFHLAMDTAARGAPCPVLFLCEDNGIGISVPTPPGAIARRFTNRQDLDYFAADGRDLAQSYEQALEAIDHCRSTRRPTFLHLNVVRLLGHAGRDVETEYRTVEEIAAIEALDPLLCFVADVVQGGALQGSQVRDLYAALDQRVRAASREAASRPQMSTAAVVMAPLQRKPTDATVLPTMGPAARRAVFGGKLPEQERPRHLAHLLSQALADLMLQCQQMVVFGEDVGRKGGVYHVTSDLQERFGTERVFDTHLDETAILGAAIGHAQLGLLPVPEIQYLAYVHNALDQIRGEAASLRFFSNDQFQNPRVVRVAAFGYQKGFGGHFHNDNSIGALRDIPGLVIAAPSRGDDAVTMLRACVAQALTDGSVVLFLEPIALYMTKDLYETGDKLWSFDYPPPQQLAKVGEPRIDRESSPAELLIVTHGNGVYLSLQARAELERAGHGVRLLDLRWLAPLPVAAILQHAREIGRVLVVDECRRTAGGVSEAILAALHEDPTTQRLPCARIAAEDTFIPLGPAANAVLPSVASIRAAALALLGEQVRA
jgi:2-oxoisovalerate dehydrogenase E1 component